MAGKKDSIVTMRVRVGEAELEVSGPSDFVEAKIAEFLKRIKTSGTGVSQRPVAAASAKGTGDKLLKSVSLSQLMKPMALKTDINRVLIAGYYLEHYTDAEKFTAAEIRDTLKAAKQPPPKNPSDVINKNIKKGHMMPAGDKDGKLGYVLTSDGEQVIEDFISNAE